MTRKFKNAMREMKIRLAGSLFNDTEGVSWRVDGVLRDSNPDGDQRLLMDLLESEGRDVADVLLEMAVAGTNWMKCTDVEGAMMIFKYIEETGLVDDHHLDSFMMRKGQHFMGRFNMLAEPFWFLMELQNNFPDKTNVLKCVARHPWFSTEMKLDGADDVDEASVRLAIEAGVFEPKERNLLKQRLEIHEQQTKRRAGRAAKRRDAIDAMLDDARLMRDSHFSAYRYRELWLATMERDVEERLRFLSVLTDRKVSQKKKCGYLSNVVEKNLNGEEALALIDWEATKDFLLEAAEGSARGQDAVRAVVKCLVNHYNHIATYRKHTVDDQRQIYAFFQSPDSLLSVMRALEPSAAKGGPGAVQILATMVDTSAPQRWNAQQFQRMPGLNRKLKMAEVEELPNICRALLEVHTHPNRHRSKNIFEEVLDVEARQKIMLMYQ